MDRNGDVQEIYSLRVRTRPKIGVTAINLNHSYKKGLGEQLSDGLYAAIRVATSAADYATDYISAVFGLKKRSGGDYGDSRLRLKLKPIEIEARQPSRSGRIEINLNHFYKEESSLEALGEYISGGLEAAWGMAKSAASYLPAFRSRGSDDDIYVLLPEESWLDATIMAIDLDFDEWVSQSSNATAQPKRTRNKPIMAAVYSILGALAIGNLALSVYNNSSDLGNYLEGVFIEEHGPHPQPPTEPLDIDTKRRVWELYQREGEEIDETLGPSPKKGPHEELGEILKRRLEDPEDHLEK